MASEQHHYPVIFWHSVDHDHQTTGAGPPSVAGQQGTEARREMKLLKILGVVGALGVLAACTSDIQRIRTTEPSGGTPFTQALTKEYRDLAVFEADEMKIGRASCRERV